MVPTLGSGSTGKAPQTCVGLFSPQTLCVAVVMAVFVSPYRVLAVSVCFIQSVKLSVNASLPIKPVL
ncbi:unnamed protein product [Arctogadus glacialis]